MSKPLTADDVLPLIAVLSYQERARLLRLIVGRSAPLADDAYRVAPPRPDEFSSDEEPLAWEGEGWDDVK